MRHDSSGRTGTLTAIVEEPEDDRREDEQGATDYGHRDKRSQDRDCVEDTAPEVVREAAVNPWENRRG